MGPEIRGALFDMDYMVSFVTLDPAYGQDSGCTYTTYYELNFAKENKIKIVPLKLFEGAWPDMLINALLVMQDKNAAALVKFAFAPSLAYLEAEGWMESLSLE